MMLCNLRRAVSILALTLTLCCSVSSAFAHEWLGSWRVEREQPAPWVVSAGELFDALPLGSKLTFEATRMRGPGVLDCANAKYAVSTTPAEGLFQGGLPNPALDAERLGLPRTAVRGLSVNCDNGLFEFHQADVDSLLFALDNRIYTLSRSAGALAAAGAPEAAVQQLLEQHYAGDMGFLPALWSAKRPALAATLNAAIDGYFAAPWPSDEPPPINGDPLTNSQEYPTRFAVGAAALDGKLRRVTVGFADAHEQRQVDFVLQNEADAWRVVDLHYPDGHRFSDMLAERPEPTAEPR